MNRIYLQCGRNDGSVEGWKREGEWKGGSGRANGSVKHEGGGGRANGRMEAGGHVEGWEFNVGVGGRKREGKWEGGSGRSNGSVKAGGQVEG